MSTDDEHRPTPEPGGPEEDSGAALEAFLDGLPSLDRGQLMAIASAWDSAGETARVAAWRSVHDAAAASGRTGELDRARDAVSGWATSRTAITGFDTGAGMDLLLIDLRSRAAPALVDAAAAILLGDRLDAPSRAALLGPWASRSGADGD